MIFKSLAKVERVKVQMAGARNVEMQLLCGPNDGCANFAMRRFIVKPGGCTPKHSHDYEHEVLVLGGTGKAFGNGRMQAVKKGDVIIVPANELHQFKNTGKSAMEFLCMVPAFVHKGGGASAPAPSLVDCAKERAKGN